MTRSRTGVPERAALLGACLLLAVGCGEDSPPDGDAAPEPAVSSRRASAETPARYRTTVAFAAADSSLGLLLRFVQTTGPGTLHRRYRGWIGGPDGWSSVLTVEDTLPAPRARWRVLPGGPLRLEAAAGGEIDAYRLRTPDGTVALRLGEQLTSWPSPTGQRERLRRASLRLADDTLRGIAVVRRTARPLSDAWPSPDGSFLLLAGEEGDGLVVVLPEGTGTPAAHGGLGPAAGPWDSVSVTLPDGTAPGRLSASGGAIAFELRPVGTGTDADEAPALVLAVSASGQGSDVLRGVLVPAGDR